MSVPRRWRKTAETVSFFCAKVLPAAAYNRARFGVYCMQEVVIMNKINQAIGCEVSDCMYNCDGKNCTLDRITVGNTCDCDAEKCTCCENYRCK